MTRLPTNNFTDEDLQEVNERIARTLIPAMVYVSIMMLFGVLGNILVCFVFITKMKRGTQNLLITSLAVFDLLSSLLAMPVEIADMRYYYTFNSEFGCKVLRFINALCCLSSIVTLVAIAVDRYLKVCRPMKTQMKLRDAKLLVGVAVCSGLVFSWPALLIYGIRTVETETPGLLGKDCSTSNSMKETVYPVIYHGILALGFVAFAVVLAVLYGLIGVAAKRHKRYMRTHVFKKNHNSDSSLECSTSDVRVSDTRTSDVRTLAHPTSDARASEYSVSDARASKCAINDLESPASDVRASEFPSSDVRTSEYNTSDVIGSDNNDVKPHPGRYSTNTEAQQSEQDRLKGIFSQRHDQSVHRMKDKTTLIGFTVTLVFVMSFLPFLSLVGARSFFKDFDYNLKDGALVAFNVFLRSYFVNSAANPIIYGVLNLRFREESIQLLRGIVFCAKSHALAPQQTSSM